MQILQWLFKIADDPNQSQSETQANHSPTAKKIGGEKINYQKKGGEKINKSTHQPNREDRRRKKKKIAEQTEIICKNLNLFKILRRKDIAKACFYSTLNLNRPENYQRNQYLHTMKLRKEDLARGLGVISSSHQIQNKADNNNNNSHVGKKVLPINTSDQSSSSSSSTNESDDQCRKKGTEKNKGGGGGGGGEKTRTISRMKELLRWAASAKSSSDHKGAKYLSRKVLQFRNKSSLKAVPDDDQLSNDSPKISFRWDLESCSTISSTYSAISMASSSTNLCNIHDQTIISLPSISVSSTPLHNVDYHSVTRSGNWITTDSEFVVLEL